MNVASTRQLGLLFAGLLVVSAVIAYVVVNDRDDAPPAHQATAARTTQATRPMPARMASVPRSNASAAQEAMAQGRAKCVAGVVYSTADHVIEPWPGNVHCSATQDGTDHGVVMAGR
jgi:hypothetical protein